MHCESQAERIPMYNDDKTNKLTIPRVQDKYKYGTQSTQTALLLDTANGYLDNTINGYGIDMNVKAYKHACALMQQRIHAYMRDSGTVQ